MQRFASLLGLCVLISALFPWSKHEASAQSCNYFAGTAIAGQNVNVDI